MKRQGIILLAVCLGGVGVSLETAGCSSHQNSPASAAELANFKGGPMPASAAKIMAEKMHQANAPRTAPADATR